MTRNQYAKGVELIDRAAVREALREVDAWTMPIAHAITALPPAKLDNLASGKAVTVGVPTEAQIASACLSYDHSFGLMDGPQRVALMHQAREWLHAWRKEFAALDLTPAPVTQEDEVTPEVSARLRSERGIDTTDPRWKVIAQPDPAPVTQPVYEKPVRYCPICDIADCATHRDAPVQPDPAPAKQVSISEAEAIREAALREAAAVVIKAMDDGKVWGSAVNAAMTILNADTDPYAWKTVSKVRDAINAAILALIHKPHSGAKKEPTDDRA